MTLPLTTFPRTDAYQAALLYSRWGWSIFPLRKKRPAVGYWTTRGGRRTYCRKWSRFKHRPADEDLLHRLFDPLKGAAGIDGLAVVLGPVAGGLAVRDFDTVAGYRSWAESHPDLARRLPTARTWRGFHVFFRLPAGTTCYRDWPSGPKGELLGVSNRYVVLPPTLHPKGVRYQWIREPLSIEDFPTLTPEQAGFVADGGGGLTDNVLDIHPASLPARCGEIGERDAIFRCLPTAPGERNECLWRLARTLKSLPHVADAPDAELWPFVEQWYESAQHVVGTKSFKTCWADFKRQWKKARPIGAGFDAAMATAIKGPTPPAAERYADPDVRNLVKVCVALQRYAGAGAFFLSCRTAQRLCGFGTHVTAWKWLSRLVSDGFLEVVERGIGGTNRRRASRYAVRSQVVKGCVTTALGANNAEASHPTNCPTRASDRECALDKCAPCAITYRGDGQVSPIGDICDEKTVFGPRRPSATER